jgi:hypothetical protein
MLVQNFGLRDGLPGTAYNKGVKAVEDSEAILLPVLREALADEEEVMKQGTIVGRLMQGLREEGADIMHASFDMKAEYFASECLFFMFAGAASSLFTLFLRGNLSTLPIQSPTHPHTLNHRDCMHECLLEILCSFLTMTAVKSWSDMRCPPTPLSLTGNVI